MTGAAVENSVVIRVGTAVTRRVDNDVVGTTVDISVMGF